MGLFGKRSKEIIEAGTDFLGEANSIIDNCITNQEERGTLKNKFSNMFVQFSSFMEGQLTERLKADNQGSMLTKNIRPITLLLLVLGYMFSFKLGLPEDIRATLGDWGQTAIMFYFGARTLEKTIPMISNFTKSLRRKG